METKSRTWEVSFEPLEGAEWDRRLTEALLLLIELDRQHRASVSGNT